MNAAWIVNEGHDRLLLFFNGWGHDSRVAEFVTSRSTTPSGRDIVTLWDYTDLSMPPWLTAGIERYRTVELVAWSLGVWAACRSGLRRADRAVAVNGTPFPVDASRGIPPEIFRGTLEHWSDASRSRFERRMFAGFDRDSRTGLVRPSRSSAGQQEELRMIGISAAESAPEPAWGYTKAFIGTRDLVFLPENQHNAWAGVPVEVVDGMPHFPFFHLAGWEAVLA